MGRMIVKPASGLGLKWTREDSHDLIRFHLR